MQTGSLGDIVFETSSEYVLTFGAFSFSASGRYVDHDVHGTKQRTEFTGADLCEFDMDITVHRAMGPTPEEVFTQLGQYCQQGTVCRLIVAGRNIGRVTVRSVDSDWRHLMPGGVGVQTMGIKLKLKEYR